MKDDAKGVGLVSKGTGDLSVLKREKMLEDLGKMNQGDAKLGKKRSVRRLKLRLENSLNLVSLWNRTASGEVCKSQPRKYLDSHYKKATRKRGGLRPKIAANLHERLTRQRGSCRCGPSKLDPLETEYPTPEREAEEENSKGSGNSGPWPFLKRRHGRKSWKRMGVDRGEENRRVLQRE